MVLNTAFRRLLYLDDVFVGGEEVQTQVECLLVPALVADHSEHANSDEAVFPHLHL